MRTAIILAAFTSTLLAPLEGRADPLARFEEGTRRFDEAMAFRKTHPAQRQEIATRFRAAAESFVACWKDGHASSEVFTNAANSYYFAGDDGEAVLFYRRALVLDPGNDSAEKGLAEIRQKLPISPRGVGGSLLRSLFFWHFGASVKGRMMVFSVLFALAWVFFSVTALVWRRPGRVSKDVRVGAGVAGAASLLGALALLGSLVVEAAGSELERDAVLLVQTRGYHGSSEQYSFSHNKPFPPGTEVTVEEESGDWVRVTLADQTDSWVRRASLARVLGRH